MGRTLLQIEELFPKQFRNMVFVGVGEVDSSQMRSHEQIELLESRMADDLQSYCDLAGSLDFMLSIAPASDPTWSSNFDWRALR